MNGCHLNKQKLLNFRGIRFKTWVYSFLMTAIILVVLLLLQVTSIATYYQNLKQTDVERVGANLLESYRTRPDNIGFKNIVLQVQRTNDVSVRLFRVDYNIVDGKVEPVNESFFDFLSSDIYGGSAGDDDSGTEAFTIDANFFLKLENENEIIFTAMTGAGAQAVYGAKINDPQDGNVFLYVSAKLYLSKFTMSALRRQAIFATIICGALSILLSWVVSNAIARPITNVSKTARKLAAGDYSVRFSGGGLSEIEDLAETLNYATEEMSKTEVLRRDLLANVSHDLRTPLTMVKAYAEMIRDLSGADPKKRISHSQTIIDEADRLTNLVNDIQNLSKLQSGTAIPDKKPFDLSALCRRVLETFEIYSAKEGYVFKPEIAEGLSVDGDEAKIEQVLYNLIGNAVNYTGEDKTVTVYLRLSEGSVYFGVKDTGKGIAPEEINTVWERYYRASQSKRTRIGTGLGLSIVKSILIMHGADSGIISKVGEGSTFWFSLPLYDPFSPSEPPEEMYAKQKKPKMLKK